MTMAIIMALLLKYFLVEAYKIPTGSMQPTLMGNEQTQVFDRILVDKLSYRFRDPLRFEVAVFRFPLDRSKNFVKRIVGMPGEDIRIQHGDLWTRPDASEPWSILRRPRPIQLETWKRLDRLDPEASSWQRASGSSEWDFEGRAIRARGNGRASFYAEEGSIMDIYTHGYPDALLDSIPRRHGRSGTNPVGDLRLEAQVTALDGTEFVEFELLEGGRTYSFSIPGPSAPSTSVAQIRVLDPGWREESQSSLKADPGFRLQAGQSSRLAVQNLDDLLELEWDGEVIASAEVRPCPFPESYAFIAARGEGADFTDLMVYRDIHYTAENARANQFTIPPGNYFMLGDNTQNSHDSREWHFVRYAYRPDDSETEVIVRGNSYGNETPHFDHTGGKYGSRVWLRDEFGEMHEFGLRRSNKLPPEEAPFVQRELILGRALAVFWPLSPSRDLYRLSWIH